MLVQVWRLVPAKDLYQLNQLNPVLNQLINSMQDQQVPRTDIGTLGEFGLIDHLTRQFPLENASSLKGVGDDAAVIDNTGYLTVVSTDMLVEGIHFDLMYTPLKHLGYKSITVNLSDIYAMNAQPKQVTVSIALSNRFSLEAVEEIYEGMRLACKHRSESTRLNSSHLDLSRMPSSA